MSADPRGRFLYELPPSVHWDFCRLMDGLSDLDWTRFASEVLGDQTSVRLAERRERRTDEVMNQWGNRNGRVGELVDLLEKLRLLRPRDVILGWMSSLKSSSPAAAPPAPPAAAPPLPEFDPQKLSKAQVTQSTCELSPTVDKGGGGSLLPGPAPPPSELQSRVKRPPQEESSSGVMCWSYEEVHAGTEGFSPSLQVGEGGFGVVFRATLKGIDCAVKRLKQDCSLDLELLKKSFQTEVDKLTKFRHPNIIQLLGISEGHGAVCLIYSYMDNRSLEDQLHRECVSLSWSQRVHVVKGASAALRFLHFPPEGHKRLLHGDVKSSNILLDHHLEPKLADFGLARFVPHRPSPHPRDKTASVGKTATIRGTLAYLPEEYVRNGELGTAVDVYSFGVVLLEVLTGRRALENDTYLKDLVEEIEESPAGSPAAAWRKELDRRLVAGGVAEPVGCMEMVSLACWCLEKKRKKRPAMTEVFDQLQNIHSIVGTNSSSSSSSSSSVGALSQQLSKLGPLEDTYHPSLSSSSSSSSSVCSLTPPHPLHSPSSLPPASSAPHSSFSLAGPCETDESRGFSQYDLRSPFKPNGSSCRSLSPSVRNQYHSTADPAESRFRQPSVPTEDQYFPPQAGSTSDKSGAAFTGPDSRGQTTAGAQGGLCGVPESLSPVGSLHSSSPGPSVHMNPCKQRFLLKKTLYEEGRIHTPELLSSHDLYGSRSCVEFRGPEESDELDYLSTKHD